MIAVRSLTKPYQCPYTDQSPLRKEFPSFASFPGTVVIVVYRLRRRRRRRRRDPFVGPNVLDVCIVAAVVIKKFIDPPLIASLPQACAAEENRPQEARPNGDQWEADIAAVEAARENV